MGQADFSRLKRSVLADGGKTPVVSAAGQAITQRSLAFLQTLVDAQQAAGVQDMEGLNTALGVHAGGGLDLGIFSHDSSGHTISIPEGAGKSDGAGGQGDMPDGLGLPKNKPTKWDIGTPQLPGQRDLQSDDSGGNDTGTHSGDGSDRHRGSVWVDRQTERSSSDGSQTWGSTLYRDNSGNFWRSDYHVERSSDGGTTTEETVFGAHGEPIKTTVTTSTPGGETTEATTNHQTGETTVVHPVDKTGGEPEPEKNQGETSGGYTTPGSGSYGSGKHTGNNKVNPGPDGGEQPTSTQYFRLDPRILTVNPSPDVYAHGTAQPKDVRREAAGGSIIDPPRPNL